MESIKTPLSAAFTAMWSKASSATRAFQLTGLDDALTGSSSVEHKDVGPNPESKGERCELRIEGMTCGACVKVRPSMSTSTGSY